MPSEVPMADKFVVYTAPEAIPTAFCYEPIFLAGGISNCHDWQSEMIRLLGEGGNQRDLINPRRDNFDTSDLSAAETQIRWEHAALQKATSILFWFPSETLCPITLYELGAHCQREVPVFVGVHPDYKRKLDVEIQTQLCRPEIQIVYSLEDLVAQVLEIR